MLVTYDCFTSLSLLIFAIKNNWDISFDFTQIKTILLVKSLQLNKYKVGDYVLNLLYNFNCLYKFRKNSFYFIA